MLAGSRIVQSPTSLFVLSGRTSSSVHPRPPFMAVPLVFNLVAPTFTPLSIINTYSWAAYSCWKGQRYELNLDNFPSLLRRRLQCRAAANDSGSQFVKKLEDLYPKATCLKCKGLREVPCASCGGRGGLGKGGYHRSNPVAMERIVGSKWTAMERTFGWRHFVVSSKRKASPHGQGWFVEMAATCDDTCRFWVNAQNLKDRERWSMGWLQKSETVPPEELGRWKTVCKACKGQRRVPCGMCANPDTPQTDIIHI